MSTPEQRKRVYVLEQTVTERFFYDPDEIKTTFADAWDSYQRDYVEPTFDGFVIHLFQLHEGSEFANAFFHDDANPSVGIDLIERWDDE